MGRRDEPSAPRLSACGFVDAPSALCRVWRVASPLGVAHAASSSRCVAPIPVQGDGSRAAPSAFPAVEATWPGPPGRRRQMGVASRQPEPNPIGHVFARVGWLYGRGREEEIYPTRSSSERGLWRSCRIHPRPENNGAFSVTSRNQRTRSPTISKFRFKLANKCGHTIGSSERFDTD